MQPFPCPNDATHKIDQDWPTGEVQKCEIFVTQGQATPN